MRDIRDPAQAEALEYEAPDAYLRRREFLQRTAMLAGLGLGAAAALHPDTLIAAATRRGALPSPRNLPIDTFVVLMMENRSFDHYLGWLPDADGIQAGLTYTDATGRPHADPPPQRRLPGLRAPGSRPLVGGRPRSRSTAAAWTASSLGRQRRVRDRLLRASGDLPFIRPTPRRRSRPTTASSARCWPRPTRTASTCTRRSPTGSRTTRCRSSTRRLPGHDDLRRARRPRASAAATSTPTSRSARSGARPGSRARPGRGVLRALRGRHAARGLVRRPGVRRRGAGHVRRRAPARRHPHRPGLHGRRRARVPGVAAVQARRAVHRLRRVGRVLRPRRAAARARRPQRAPTSTRTSARWASASPRWPSRPTPGRGHVDHGDLRLRVDPEDDRLPLRAAAARPAATPTPATSPASFDFEAKPRLEPPDLPHPAHIMSAACPPRARARRARSRTTWSTCSASGYLERLRLPLPARHARAHVPPPVEARAVIADDPVRLTVTRPRRSSSVVEADAGALDPRAGAIHVRVKLAARCGGSFAGTGGITAIDATPAQPAPGTAVPRRGAARPRTPRRAATRSASSSTTTKAASGRPTSTRPYRQRRPAYRPAPTRRAARGSPSSPRKVTRGSLLAGARITRKRGHAILLVRVRTPARVSVRVGRRSLKARHPRPCRTRRDPPPGPPRQGAPRGEHQARQRAPHIPLLTFSSDGRR